MPCRQTDALLATLCPPGSDCLSSMGVEAVVGGAAVGCSAMQGAAENSLHAGLLLADLSALGLPCCQWRTALSALPSAARVGYWKLSLLYFKTMQQKCLVLVQALPSVCKCMPMPIQLLQSLSCQGAFSAVQVVPSCTLV